VVFDILRRLLKHKGFEITYVQNFTDVDDKIIRRAKEMGVTAQEVATKFITAYFKDFDALNVLRADHYPKATEFIAAMQEIIKGLIDKGFAYLTPTGVYFDVSKFLEYGKLSKRKIEELKAGARVEVDVTKKDPLDFALWKFTDDEPRYPSPWGEGRPGWHIECSAMVWKLLGETIDVHGGGEDLIFPHHENEIAQSESFTGRPLARIWMHVGLLKLGKDKMSKSLGNIITIREALPEWGPNTIRYFLLMAHYRNQLEFTEKGLRNAAENWRIIESAAYDLIQPYGVKEEPSLIKEAKEAFEAFEDALSHDLNTPKALMELVRLSKAIGRVQARRNLGPRTAREVNTIFSKMLDILGFRLPEVRDEEKDEIEGLIRRRSALRKEKRFKEADEIREVLKNKKILLVDIGEKTFWRKVEHL
jgi:cysteinyl-tRNA synthetase